MTSEKNAFLAKDNVTQGVIHEVLNIYRYHNILIILRSVLQKPIGLLTSILMHTLPEEKRTPVDCWITGPGGH